LFWAGAPTFAFVVTGLAARAVEAERGRDDRVIGLGRAASGAVTVTGGSASWAAWASASELIEDSIPQSTGKLALLIARMRNISLIPDIRQGGRSTKHATDAAEQRANGSVCR
jgi:hypothetical protein